MNSKNIKPRAMRDTFLESIYQLMLKDEKIIFISADFGSPVLDKIRLDCPNQFFNVGIAEQNLINISAGVSLEGNKVFAYAIAPFITMRCFEQIRVNLALLSKVRSLNVSLIGVGAGYSYVVSGPTHQCYEDISIIRSLPNIDIFSPSDQIIAEKIPSLLVRKQGIKYVRLDAQVLDVIDNKTNFNKGYRVLRDGKDLTIISTGYVTHTALKVSDILFKKGFSIKVLDLINITNFNQLKLLDEIKSTKIVVSLEEGFVGRGGIDSILLNLLNKLNVNKKFRSFGVNPDYIFEIGERNYIHELIGIGPKKLVVMLTKLLREG